MRQYWQMQREFFAWLSSPGASKTYHTFQRPGTATLPRRAPRAVATARARKGSRTPDRDASRRDQGIAVGLPARLLQRLVNGVHAVIAADREEVRVAPVHFVEHLDELDVERGIALVVVMPRRDDAEAGVAHHL